MGFDLYSGDAATEASEHEFYAREHRRTRRAVFGCLGVAAVIVVVAAVWAVLV